MGHFVIELAEPGRMDGQEVAVPEDEDTYLVMENERGTVYRTSYRFNGRRNQRTGTRIFERVTRVRVEGLTP